MPHSFIRFPAPVVGKGDTVRTTLKLSIAALAIAAGLAACSGGRATDTAKADDFKRDLQLASSTTMDLAGAKVDPALLNSLETKPQGAPQAAKTIKKGAGNRAVRSKAPTVRATPETDVAATDDHSEQVTTVATAPVPEPTHEPVAVAPRPVPIVVQAGDATAGDYGTGGSGGGVFGGGGGIGGVIIRGGGVDGDHCEPHGGRGRTTRGPVYTNPGVIIIGRRIDAGSRPTFPLVSRPRISIGLGARVRGR
jgi:hypothetical protein